MTPDEEMNMLQNLAQIAGKRAERGTVVCRAPAPVTPTTETWRVIVDTPEGPHAFETMEVTARRSGAAWVASHGAYTEQWGPTARAAVAIHAGSMHWPVVEILGPLGRHSVEIECEYVEKIVALEAEVARLRRNERDVSRLYGTVGDIERRAGAAKSLADRATDDPIDKARCNGKHNAYEHAAELVLAALKNAEAK